MSPQNIIASLLVLLIIFFEILVAMTNKNKWLMAIPMIVWMIHSLIFYFSIGYIKDNVLINTWSQTLRIHGYLTLLSLSAYRFMKYRKVGYKHI